MRVWTVFCINLLLMFLWVYLIGTKGINPFLLVMYGLSCWTAGALVIPLIEAWRKLDR